MRIAMHHPHALSLLCAAAIVLVGCGNEATEQTITETRQVDEPAAIADPDATTEERLAAQGPQGLGMTGQPDAPPDNVEGPGAPAMANDAGVELAWDAPAQWQQAPDRPMREATFTLGADSQTECYVSQFPGTVGGIAANVNRWRREVGQPPIDEAAVEELPTVEMMGREAILVEAQGDFAGMGRDALPGARLLGVICPMPDSTVFVKMTGPDEEVADERERFIAFCRSMRVE